MNLSHDVSGTFWIMFWHHKRLAKWSCERTPALQNIDLGIFWRSFCTATFKANEKTTGFSFSPVCNLRIFLPAQVLALLGRMGGLCRDPNHEESDQGWMGKVKTLSLCSLCSLCQGPSFHELWGSWNGLGSCLLVVCFGPGNSLEFGMCSNGSKILTAE